MIKLKNFGFVIETKDFALDRTLIQEVYIFFHLDENARTNYSLKNFGFVIETKDFALDRGR